MKVPPTTFLERKWRTTKRVSGKERKSLHTLHRRKRKASKREKRKTETQYGAE